MGQIFVHVGYPKCASTFLQNQIFWKSPHLMPPEASAETIHWLVEKSEDQAAVERRDRLMAELAAKAKADPRPLVVSNEALIMGGWMPDYPWSAGDDYRRMAKPEVIADRIIRNWPDCKVIFVLRPQYDWIESWWRQNIMAISHLSIDDFIETDFYENSIRPYLDYHHMVKLYSDRIGLDRVRVWFFSDLPKDPNSFVQNCFDHLAIPSNDWDRNRRNEGHSNGFQAMMRQSNKVFAKFVWPVFGEKSKNTRLAHRYTKIWKSHIGHLEHILLPLTGKRVSKPRLLHRIQSDFQHSNARLADMLNIDLRERGFHV